jgi:nitrite reductase/ring-hydroxylating ferredoxin subunit
MLHRVATVAEFEDLKPRFVDIGGSKVGVYRYLGKYYAYLNLCPHQGGPACEGLVLGNIEAEVLDKGNVREFVSSDHFDITCPWHGAEFDITSGVSRSNPRDRLRAFEVIVENGEVLVKK